MNSLKILTPLIAAVAFLLSGCAANSSIEQPTFTPSLLGGNKDIALVFETAQQNPGYGVNQTGIATPGLIKDGIEGGNASNSSVFTRAAFALPQHEDLHALFLASLDDKLKAGGYQTFKAKHVYGPTRFDPAATLNGEREWVVYIEGLRIQYFATTMLSSYKPRIGAIVVPYNTRTKVLYKPMYLDFTLEDNSISFATSGGVMENIPKSFEGLKQNTKAAGVAAAALIIGR